MATENLPNLGWLARLDSLLFSPPHTFEAVFALVVLRLGLLSDVEHRAAVEESTRVGEGASKGGNAD
jgi:hypothetical protein